MAKKTESNKYLVSGDDPYLLRDYISKKAGELEIVRYDDGDQFVQAITSDNIFRSKKVIVLTSLEKEILDALREVIDTPTDDIWIIVEQETLPKNKSYTYIRSSCTVVDIKKATDVQRAVWVRQWLSSAGLKFEEDIPSKLAEKVDGNVSDLYNETQKIIHRALSCGYESVAYGFCESTLSMNRGVQFFGLMDDFFRKRLSDVLRQFRKVDEYSYVKLLHFMIGQVERIYRVAVYREQGASDNDIGEMLGVPYFIVKSKYAPALAFYGKVKLMQLLDMFNDLDLKLRTTKYPKGILFESFLLKAMKS